MHASRFPGPFGARTSAAAPTASNPQALDPERRVLLRDVGELFSAANGFAQIALLDLEADHPSREALEMLARVLWRAQNVSHGLASEDAAGACRLRPTDLRRVARQAVEIAEGLAPAGIEVELTVPRTRAPVRADDGVLVRLLVHLMHQAFQSMESAHGTRVDVQVEWATPGHPGAAAVIVRDNGPGMSSDDLRDAKRLIYEQAEDDRREGLGLWLAERVARRHGGSLEIESAHGAGTEVRLLLPISSS